MSDTKTTKTTKAAALAKGGKAIVVPDDHEPHLPEPVPFVDTEPAILNVQREIEHSGSPGAQEAMMTEGPESGKKLVIGRFYKFEYRGEQNVGQLMSVLDKIAYVQIWKSGNALNTQELVLAEIKNTEEITLDAAYNLSLNPKHYG